MGLPWGELMASEAVFRDTVALIDGLLKPLAGWSPCTNWPLTKRTHASIRLRWRSWHSSPCSGNDRALAQLGITPDGVVGHSVGETAALSM